MKKNFIKFACGFAAAALAFTLTACDDSSSATEPSSEEISSESNGGEGSHARPLPWNATPQHNSATRD